MGNRSLRKQIRMVMLLLLVVIVMLYSFSFFQIYQGYKSRYFKDFEIISTQYMNSFSRDISLAQNQVKGIFTQSFYYRQLSKEYVPDPEWVKYTYHIKQELKQLKSSLSFTGGYFFYDHTNDALFSSFNDYSKSEIGLNNALKNVLRSDKPSVTYTDVFIYDEDTFLIYWLKWNHNPIGFLVDISHYFTAEEGMEIIFVLQENKIAARIGELILSDKEIFDNIINEGVKTHRDEKFLSVSTVNPEIPIKMMLVSINQQNNLFRIPEVWGFLVFVLPVIIAFYSYFYKTMKKTLISPIEHFSKRLAEVREDKMSSDLNSRSQIVEYAQINDEIDTILTKIVNLREEKLKEQIRTNEALLQYYQLQTNPHFYLNCLNTIDVLLENNRQDIASEMILALSRHFRYMFRENRAFVSMKEEIEETQAYCYISGIRRGFPVVLETEISNEAMEFQVPLLSVFTFIENSIKHNDKSRKMLTLRVQASIIPKNNREKILNLRITDNGSGFTEKAITNLNQPFEHYEYRTNNIGIQNLKYRARLLYQTEAEMFFYNSPYQGAVVELNLPEVTSEHIDY